MERERETHATGALLIQVLLPLITNPPPEVSETSSAVVSIPAGSEPWFGSVKPCGGVKWGIEGIGDGMDGKGMGWKAGGERTYETTNHFSFS